MRWPSIATIRSPGCSCPATTESAVSDSTSAGCSHDCQYRPARIGTRRSSKPGGSCDSGRLRTRTWSAGSSTSSFTSRRSIAAAVSAMLASPRVTTGRSSTRSTRSPLVRPALAAMPLTRPMVGE